MQTFQMFIEDDRYSVPTLMFVEAATAVRAKARALELLLRSPHHLQVAVYVDDRHLFTIDPPEGRQALDQSEGRPAQQSTL